MASTSNFGPAAGSHTSGGMTQASGHARGRRPVVYGAIAVVSFVVIAIIATVAIAASATRA